MYSGKIETTINLNQKFKLIIVKLKTQDDTEFFMNNVLSWANQKFRNPRDCTIIHQDQGLLIPKEIETLGINRIEKIINEISHENRSRLYIKGTNRLRIEGNFKDLPEDAINKILNLIHPVSISVSRVVMKLVEKNRFYASGGLLK